MCPLLSRYISVYFCFFISLLHIFFFFFFFNDTATTEIYTLSLHDALPICLSASVCPSCSTARARSIAMATMVLIAIERDRKSTRLNSSHSQISYAVFCLKKKKTPAHHSQELRTNHNNSRSR